MHEREWSSQLQLCDDVWGSIIPFYRFVWGHNTWWEILNLVKNELSYLIFASWVWLYDNNLTIKLSLCKSLKLFKFLKNFKLKLNKMYLSNLIIIINHIYMIFFWPSDSSVRLQASVCTSYNINSYTLIVWLVTWSGASRSSAYVDCI